MTPSNGIETATCPPARHWLLIIEGDCEPFLVGPLDESEVLARAREHRANDPSMDDGLYALSLDVEGNLSVGAFAHEELEPQG
ncbi:hypothetical protein [uncultured Thiodictyon sp.]|uniref:hypothetical protein n=1 Tax=uncultured Thiodictyon sp. TaxID=1846217 RepID=UPI0025FB3783|nr:hypothetical protein [uncultured Thiodictyon sp.]